MDYISSGCRLNPWSGQKLFVCEVVKIFLYIQKSWDKIGLVIPVAISIELLPDCPNHNQL